MTIPMAEPITPGGLERLFELWGLLGVQHSFCLQPRDQVTVDLRTDLKPVNIGAVYYSFLLQLVDVVAVRVRVRPAGVHPPAQLVDLLLQAVLFFHA